MQPKEVITVGGTPRLTEAELQDIIVKLTAYRAVLAREGRIMSACDVDRLVDKTEKVKEYEQQRRSKTIAPKREA